MQDLNPKYTTDPFLSELSKIIEKITPHKGDILLVNLPANINPHALTQIQKALTPLEAFYEYIFKFIIVPNGMSIECLTVEEMNSLGWYKKEQLDGIPTKSN